MGAPIEPEAFVREYLFSFLESRLLNGLITTDAYHDHLSELRRDSSLGELSQRLFESAPDPVRVGLIVFLERHCFRG